MVQNQSPRLVSGRGEHLRFVHVAVSYQNFRSTWSDKPADHSVRRKNQRDVPDIEHVLSAESTDHRCHCLERTDRGHRSNAKSGSRDRGDSATTQLIAVAPGRQLWAQRFSDTNELETF